MRVWKYLRSFLGIIAISLLFSIPVHASTLTTELYDKIYNSWDSGKNAFIGQTGNEVSGLEFEIHFKNPVPIKWIWRSGIEMIDCGDGRVITSDNSHFQPQSSTVSYIKFRLKPNSSYMIYFKDMSDTQFNPDFEVLEKQPTRPFSTVEPSPEPPKDYDSFIDLIIDSILNGLKDLKKYGIHIIILAVGLGVIFIGGRWLWGKLKSWLSNV